MFFTAVEPPKHSPAAGSPLRNTHVERVVIMKENYTVDHAFLIGRQVPLACHIPETMRELPRQYILCFIERGCLDILLDGVRYVCSGPAFLCLNPKQSFRLLSSRDLTAASLIFHPSFLNKNLTDEFLSRSEFEDFCDVHDVFKLRPFFREDFRSSFITGLSPSLVSRTRALFNAAADELQEQPDWYWTCRTRSFFMDILSILERLYYSHSDPEEKTAYDFSIPDGYEDVGRILFAIWSQYYEPGLTTRRLAALVNCDPSTVYRRFRKVTGTTAGEYLINYRLYSATVKLRFTELTVSEIAVLSGFSSESYFCRLFKARRGITPGAFRRQAVEERKRSVLLLESSSN